MVKEREEDSGLGTEGLVGAGSGLFLGTVGFSRFRVVGRGSGLADLFGVDAAVVGYVAAQIGCYGVLHDQHLHPSRRHALDGQQTWIALAAFNLRHMLR
jgi:hypothetical protein